MHRASKGSNPLDILFYHSTLRNIPEERRSHYDTSCNRRQGHDGAVLRLPYYEYNPELQDSLKTAYCNRHARYFKHCPSSLATKPHHFQCLISETLWGSLAWDDRKCPIHRSRLTIRTEENWPHTGHGAGRATELVCRRWIRENSLAPVRHQTLIPRSSSLIPWSLYGPTYPARRVVGTNQTRKTAQMQFPHTRYRAAIKYRDKRKNFHLKYRITEKHVS